MAIQGLTMHGEDTPLALSLGGFGFSVASTLLPDGSHSKVPRSVGSRAARDRLVSHLLSRSRRPDGSSVSGLCNIHSEDHRWNVVYDSLGKPHLNHPESSWPAVSMSYSGGRLWVAVGGSSVRLGLDVASPEDFTGDYPFSRAFTERDWSALPEGFETYTPRACAFLWSLKEAAVKCIGSGFHRFGPWEMSVQRATGKGEKSRFRVCFHALDAQLAQVLDSLPVMAAAWPAGESWLALACCGRSAAAPLRRLLLHRRSAIP
ncbi:MAG: 4'-phosphopantetheinyl transferase superfamily protein [Deltaproteobacteria bacterium]|nr:4'-phosphopantetheinyl transferase superfamily protein [Deltaproteobacteria bacterium]